MWWGLGARGLVLQAPDNRMRARYAARLCPGMATNLVWRCQNWHCLFRSLRRRSTALRWPSPRSPVVWMLRDRGIICRGRGDRRTSRRGSCLCSCFSSWIVTNLVNQGFGPPYVCRCAFAERGKVVHGGLRIEQGLFPALVLCEGTGHFPAQPGRIDIILLKVVNAD